MGRRASTWLPTNQLHERGEAGMLHPQLQIPYGKFRFPQWILLFSHGNHKSITDSDFRLWVFVFPSRNCLSWDNIHTGKDPVWIVDSTKSIVDFTKSIVDFGKSIVNFGKSIVDFRNSISSSTRHSSYREMSLWCTGYSRRLEMRRSKESR